MVLSIRSSPGARLTIQPPYSHLDSIYPQHNERQYSTITAPQLFIPLPCSSCLALLILAIRSRRPPARPRARRSPPPPLSAAAATGQPGLAPRSLPLPRRSHCPPASGGGEWRHGSEVAGPLAFVIHKARRRLAAAGPGVGLGFLEDAGPGKQGATGREPSVSIPLLGAHSGLVPLDKYITSHQALPRRKHYHSHFTDEVSGAATA